MRMIQVSLNAGQGAGFSVWAPQSADGRWLVESNRDFYQRLIIEANRIAVRNSSGAANFIVATPSVCAILRCSLNSSGYLYKVMLIHNQLVSLKLVILVEDSTCTVTHVPRVTMALMDARRNLHGGGEYALLGYKGPEFYDTGLIYCPYIPIMVQRTIGPNDFAPRVGLLTRYGVVDNIFGANLYYHVILVTGLGQAFTPATQSVYF
jgi:hypothetical protein